MRIKTKYALVVLLALLALAAQAQKVFFTGLGRTIITNDALKGNILKNDTATPNKATNGYVLFDLGVNIQPTDYVKVKAIFRLKNQFGAFFGQGSSVVFRQVLLEGLISKKVRYALGDIDVMMTPYTMFNNEDTYNEYEADVFRIRRDIVYYENFNFGNNWRIQGGKAYTNILFKNQVSKIKINTFAARTRPTNYINLPDRFLMGASAMGDITKDFNVGLNYIRFFDLPGQVGSTRYKVDVLTGTASIQKDDDYTLLKLSGEGGYSFYKNVISTDSSAINNDFFYTTALHYKYKPANIQFYGGYKEVGPHFSSPAAQTLRINISQGPNLFPDVLNNQAQRGQLLYDRFTDPTIYNQTIMPVLMPYLPQYGNVLPYGDATPNRVGWNLGIGLGDKTKFINLTGRADVLKEVIGEGTPSLRKFILVRGGASFQINKLLQSERIFTLSVGTKIENTQRQAPASVSLTSTQLDVGLTIETIKNLDLMGGYKSLSANGNEYTAIRNSLNEISGFTPVNLNFRQDIVSAGIRYRFTTRSFFTVNGNYSFNNMYSNSNIGYRINEYFVNYTLIF